jgi:hypothetical protein
VNDILELGGGARGGGEIDIALERERRERGREREGERERGRDIEATEVLCRWEKKK